MKSSITLGLIAALLIGVTSCNDEGEEVLDTNISEELEISADETEIEALFEDIDDLSTLAFNSEVASNGRIEEDGRFSCAEIIRNEETRTITISFPEEGCEGPGGLIRRGIISINYNGNRFLPGSSITWTLIDFSINNVQIEGIRTLENVSASTDEAPMHRISLSEGRATFPDGTVATRTANRIRTWNRAANPINDNVEISQPEDVNSSAEGVTRNGVQYRVVIVEPLVFSRVCRRRIGIRAFIPVSGVKQVSRNGEVFTIDFGDGTCDTIATITNSEGRSEEVDLSNR